MTSVRTNKKQLSGWVSDETYSKVSQLCSGSPYRSISEYIVTLVNRDLALRDASRPSSSEFIPSLLLALDDPVVRSKILSLFSDTVLSAAASSDSSSLVIAEKNPELNSKYKNET